MDVFVDDSHRGKGVGKMLLNLMFEYPALQKVNGIGLRTSDAFGYYKKYGY